MAQTYRVYSIGTAKDEYKVSEESLQDFYSTKMSCRKARVGYLPNHKQGEIFRDKEFEIKLEQQVRQSSQFQQDKKDRKDKKLGLRRIYEFYDKEFKIFSEDYYKPFHLELTNDDEELPTFLSEFSMIDREYIKTRFFTKDINRQGYYQYFIRRNGEYYVEFIDDLIPVTEDKKNPLWGLTLKEPWRLIIMKAWIKEKRGIKGVIQAKPYQFIEAFGFPGYRALSIKKEIDFLRASKIAEEVKEKKRSRIKINQPGFITVGKTRDNANVLALGLKKNRAGYKIVPIDSLITSSIPKNDGSKKSLSVSRIEDEQNLYKVQSELPCFWVGEYSVVSPKINAKYAQNIHKLNIEKEFLATYTEISQVFSKFYMAPQYSSRYFDGYIKEDSIHIPINQSEPYYFFELEIAEKGSLNLNIDLPVDSAFGENGHIRYSPIKYFLTRKSEPGDVGAQVSEGYLFGGDSYGDYKFYDGEYVKGYHKSLNRFLQINKGKYFIYVKIDNKRKIDNKQKPAGSFAINISTTAVVKKFRQTEDLTAQQESAIIKSTFYAYSRKAGIRCYVHKEVKDLKVYICNSFDELGFSFISLYAHAKAKGSLAMSVNLRKLLVNKIKLCAESLEERGQQVEAREDLKLIAKPGEPEVLVLERTERARSKEEQFPPEGSIDFYEIY